MIARSNRPDVRNPILGDAEAMAEWLELKAKHPAAAKALQKMLRGLSKKWRAQANEIWNNGKAPMGRYQRKNADVALDVALILKATGVYARHIAVAGDKAIPCGKVFDGHPCTMPKGLGCPDCIAIHDVQEGS